MTTVLQCRIDEILRIPEGLHPGDQRGHAQPEHVDALVFDHLAVLALGHPLPAAGDLVPLPVKRAGRQTKVRQIIVKRPEIGPDLRAAPNGGRRGVDDNRAGRKAGGDDFQIKRLTRREVAAKQGFGGKAVNHRRSSQVIFGTDVVAGNPRLQPDVTSIRHCRTQMIALLVVDVLTFLRKLLAMLGQPLPSQPCGRTPDRKRADHLASSAEDRGRDGAGTYLFLRRIGNSSALPPPHNTAAPLLLSSFSSTNFR